MHTLIIAFNGYFPDLLDIVGDQTPDISSMKPLKIVGKVHTRQIICPS